ncbi:hypothetical protein [Paraflavitalea sp. CAU 1676]|uniref:hypothetical protein n=1 Tax=Paraflavitalea sp. CAU 1676 TaxID=3032598 RepID=UPI0023DA695B|nr:hypothetical protein [Paraflavitalea sp. CAU 1676]MDF2189288.1 hypothetical protein [Paraflavitalea sp. CAU 1676]
MPKPVDIVVGRGQLYDPIAGSSAVNVPWLAGQEIYVEKVGYGTWNYDLWSPKGSGGFQLEGSTFLAGERFYIHYSGFVSTLPGSSGYTNGFDKARVIPALFGRVGWSQSLVAGAPVVNPTNQESKSGRYFQEFHNIVTVANVRQTMEEIGANDANLNQHLTNLQRSCVLRCLNAVFQKPEYLQELLLFNRIGQNDTPVTNTGQFVGYEINLAPANNISVQVEAATLLFDQDVTFNLYLFKDGKKSPIRVVEVAAVAYEATVVNFADLVLSYYGATTKGGRFYLGYFQDDLGPAKAIREQVCRAGQPLCYSAEPVYMKKNAGEYDFNRDQRSYTVEPYGINLEMSVFRDFTNVIVKKAHLFDEVIGLTNAYIVIEQILYAVRSNATERILKDQLDRFGLQLELLGAVPIQDSPRIKGLAQKIEAEFKRMRDSFFPRQKPMNVNLC